MQTVAGKNDFAVVHAAVWYYLVAKQNKNSMTSYLRRERQGNEVQLGWW